MKTLVLAAIRVCALAAFALASPFAWAQTGIGGTAHDFSGNTANGETSGACTYCHTPHQASQQNLLWNRTLAATNYTWGAGAVTTGGTFYPTFQGTTYNGTTVKCLSCHDGSVAVGDVAWWAGGAATFGDPVIPAGPFQVGAGGAMGGNHPVAMPYPLNNLPSNYNGTSTGTGTVMEWVDDPTVLGIRIYNDDGLGNISAGPVPGQSGIECASCHDPHNSSTVQGPFFLRGTIGGNTADYICRKCHAK
jgi:hypothetical protein